MSWEIDDVEIAAPRDDVVYDINYFLILSFFF
jgi:hypothetical protein